MRSNTVAQAAGLVLLAAILLAMLTEIKVNLFPYCPEGMSQNLIWTGGSTPHCQPWLEVRR